MSVDDKQIVAAEIIKLQDGRRLAYNEFGDPTGKPSFFFHGWPGARLQARVSHAISERLGVRIITLDRPGFGQSDFQHGRSILDWPDDVEQLADALRIDRFAVLGLSGGAPYALACARKIPQRLTSVGVVSGLGPSDTLAALNSMSRFNRTMIRIARLSPRLFGLLMGLRARRQRRDPEGAFARLVARLPQADARALSRPEIRQILMAAGNDSLQPGTRGHTWEMRLFARPWKFRLEEIDIPVSLWHGGQDDVVPAMGRYLAATLPNCTATFVPDAGHYSMMIDHVEEIISTIMFQ